MPNAETVILQYITTQCDMQTEIVLMNHFLGNWEMDLLIINEAGHARELEIKLSRADYLNDARKSYSILGKKVRKHDKIAKGDYPCSSFSFVVPRDLVAVEEVPIWAGLIYFDALDEEALYTFETVKEPAQICNNSFWDTCTTMDIALMLSKRNIYSRQQLATLKEKAKIGRFTGFGR